MLNGRADAYIQAAIDGEIAKLASANIGERNLTLFKATANLASLAMREGQVIEVLRPAAENVGLRGREFYSTIKSGMKAGQSRPRALPDMPSPAHPALTAEVTGEFPARSAVDEAGRQQFPARSAVDEAGRQPRFFVGGDEGPRATPDEIRRHVYRRGSEPVRIKIKRGDGFVNWYRVHDHGREGWQAGKPEGYLPCPYIGSLDPFDSELDGDLLFWPEGEKDCDNLGNQAFPAFTFGGTGDGLSPNCADYVRGRHLIILADNDPPGRLHASRKAELASGLAVSIKIIEFPELSPGGDVSDFLRIHTPDELKERVAATPVWMPPSPPDPGLAAPKASRALLTCTLSDVLPEKVEWLWPGRVAIGKLTMIAGEPGLGKSQLSIAVAAAVTTGGLWPDSDGRAPLGSVIILSAEDGLADTIRPRFDAAGGDPSRVMVIRAVQSNVEGGSGRHSFNLAADLALLEDEIKKRGDVRLVLIDPVSSYLGKIDSHKNADVRSVLEPLGETAERLRVAVLAITHLSKGDGKAINRFVGSIAFVAAARTAFAVVADAEDDAGLRRLFLQVKNNIAAPQPGLAFRLAQQEVAPGVIGSAVAWDDTLPVTVNVDQALSGSTDGEATAKDDAVDFLREVLAAGPVDVLDIEAEARASAMLSETRRLKESKPFRTAAHMLGVIKKRMGFGPGARVQWLLPENANESELARGLSQ